MSDLRSIDVDHRRYLPPEDVRAGAVPELRWLDIDTLRVDDSFQRPLGKSNWAAIDKIAKGFNWSMFTPVVVAPIVGGLYSLIDGQHRTHAAKIAGFTQVPAMIVMTAEAGQAAAFAAINGSVIRMTAPNIYKAALAANVDWAVRSRDAVEAAGCRLLTYNPSRTTLRVGSLNCIMEIRRHVEAGRSAMITAALDAVRSQPGVTVNHFAVRVLVPWFYALIEVGPGTLDADLRTFCAAHDLLKILDAMTVVAKRPDYVGKSPRELAKATLVTLLRRHLSDGTTPLAVSGEAAIAEQMAAVAARERKAMRAVT
ncbi:ParB/Srx family N-terminal domain-containing protein [Defluviimonas aestuarii]|uniref:ParB/Srx family N-terminal domain-containing protein n=1 Tax=Albidovulum aestuarii TaxID=1130726 RepID=UPI00249C7BE3|nr:ParB/Srx family N-terminal domain-containing protein [Defluviimonas aestuarii]MDI3335884.1 ParB/Srx family N-terminal domain-containing protein [Defluviimonas aestuarii]